MPNYEGGDKTVLHYDLLGANEESPLIVLAGGRHGTRTTSATSPGSASGTS